jgi:UDP-glucose 4-epimerase
VKIVVTGGAGFIGSHIVDAYLERGHEVHVFDANLNPKAKLHQVDIAERGAATTLEQIKPEVLCHHAAQMDVRRSVADPTFDARVNILGFVNLLEAGKNSGLKKVIFASSGGAVYGEQETIPAAEDHVTRPASP